MIYIARAALSVQKATQEECAMRIYNTVDAFCKKNRILVRHLQAIIFTQTHDITELNPAQLLRTYKGFDAIALFCTQEPEYEESLPKVIRMLIFFRVFRLFYIPKPVYKYGTEILRSDLFKKNNSRKEMSDI